MLHEGAITLENFRERYWIESCHDKCYSFTPKVKVEKADQTLKHVATMALP